MLYRADSGSEYGALLLQRLFVQRFSGVDKTDSVAGRACEGVSIANVARFYDPENGRFVSQDSYRGEQTEPGTWHLYAYCANDPVNFVDPSGHDAIVLKSNFVNDDIGHTALIIQDKKTWRYFTWDPSNWGNKHMNKNVKKSVKKKKVRKNMALQG